MKSKKSKFPDYLRSRNRAVLYLLLSIGLCIVLTATGYRIIRGLAFTSLEEVFGSVLNFALLYVCFIEYRSAFNEYIAKKDAQIDANLRNCGLYDDTLTPAQQMEKFMDFSKSD